MTALGAQLVEAARLARHEATLISPFVKVSALRTIIENVDPAVRLRVVARWIPAEIAIGVCDLEIFDLVAARGQAELFVHPLLHAKLYRFDERTFIGSANLTAKAMGWVAPSNIEILHAPDAQIVELRTLETDLLRSSIKVNAAYRDALRAQVEMLKASGIAAQSAMEAETHSVDRNWLPTCRTPDWIWRVYSEGEAVRRRMVDSAFEAAEADLRSIAVGSGLPESIFNQHVAAILESMPLIREVDAAASQGLSNAEAVKIIERAKQASAMPYEADAMWEVLRAWLVHFFPHRYYREPTSEVFRHGRVIG